MLALKKASHILKSDWPGETGKDCAEDVQRYGFPSYNSGPEIEAETAKFIQAWEKGDYEVAGFEGLAQYVEE